MDIYSALPGCAVLLLLVLAARQALEWRPGLRHAVEAEAKAPAFMGQLEGLRGLLAIGVVLHHAVVRFILLPRSLHWGYPPSRFYGQLASVPVLMFFFLTGFLFWSKLLRNPHLPLRPYLVARLRRLAPVYLFAMVWFFLLIAAATHFTLHEPLKRVLAEGFKWLAFSLPGQPEVNGLKDTWELIAGTPWTLAFEWQFYLVLPLLVWFARKPGRCIMLLAGAWLAFFSATHLMTWHGIAGRSAIVSLLHAVYALSGHMFFSFGIGIAVAAVRARWPEGHPFLRSVLASWLCLLVSMSVLFGLHPASFRWFESRAMGLVFLPIAYGNTMWQCLTSRTALLLGRCSYSLYLCHGLVLSSMVMFIERWRGSVFFAGWIAWLLIAAGSLLAFGVAVLCHEYVESPWLARKERRSATRGISLSQRHRVQAPAIG